VELKLLGIAGVGFLVDAYDLFIINQVSIMLQYRLYGKHHIPAALEGVLKAGANIGAVIGQITFGFLADALGRKAIYGKELMIIILATILALATPTGSLSPDHAIGYLAGMRIFLGIGVGADYPMASTIMTDRAKIRKRGALLSYIFSNQGWGALTGCIVTMITLQAYKPVIHDKGEISKLDGVWRIIVGVSLVPAFATLYQRLVLPESQRYKKARGEMVEDATIEKASPEDSSVDGKATETGSSSDVQEAPVERAHFSEFVKYFSEWRHFKILLGTMMCWFLVDISFYGINLNTNVVLDQIGYAGKTGSEWEKLFNLATGSLIITALGFVPGYWATITTVEYIGRKPIQFGGFLMEALFLAILAAKFHTLSKAGFIVCFTFLQFFFNFGANGTTFLYPAEVFPTRFRATAHGMSAAAGKAGAIISSLAFNAASKKIGTPAVLWIFFGVSILGALFTLLLPEVKDRDPDQIDRLEREEAERIRRAA